MKSPRLTAAVLAIALVLTATATTSAATITYANRATFESTLFSSVTDDYENASYVFIQDNATMSAVLGETDYLTTGHSNNNIVFDSGSNHQYCAGCNGSFELGFTTTSVGDANGVFGVGLDYFNSGSPAYVAFVTFGDNSTAEYSLNQSFFGVTSSLSIKTIHFGLTGGGTTINGSFGLDNLTIGSEGVVPEPSSLVLLGIGAVGLALFGVRRKLKVDSKP